MQGSPRFTMGSIPILALAALALAALPRQASADLTWDLSYVFSGSTGLLASDKYPTVNIKTINNPNPTFDQVEVVLDWTNLTANGPYLSELFLNFGPNPATSALDPTQLSASLTSSTGTFTFQDLDTKSVGDEAVAGFKADGDGYFDLRFDFATANGQRFNPGEKATFLVSYALGDISAENFNYSSYSPGGTSGPFLAAAHLQGLGTDGQLSIWVAPSDNLPPSPGDAPEPTTIAAALLGLIPAAWALRRRRQR